MWLLSHFIMGTLVKNIIENKNNEDQQPYSFQVTLESLSSD